MNSLVKTPVFCAAFALLMAAACLAQDAVPSPAEITKMAEAETAKVFNDAYKAKVSKESWDKHPDIKPGDKITVPLRVGSGFADKTGTLRSVNEDGSISVNFGGAGDKKILKVDIPIDILAGVTDENSFRRANYVQKNFTLARAQYKKAAVDRLYHENGYVYDADLARWTPKIKQEERKSEPTAEAAGSDAPVVEPVREIVTLSGERYSEVSVQKINADNVEILHSKGASVLKFDMLPERLRKYFMTKAEALHPAESKPERQDKAPSVSQKEESGSSASYSASDDAPAWSDGKTKKTQPKKEEPPPPPPQSSREPAGKEAAPNSGKNIYSGNAEDETLKAIKAGIKAFGSGAIVSADGCIITNFHVVKTASKIAVRAEDKTYKAKLLAKDPDNDLALLKIEGSFTPISLSHEKQAKAGQTVFTIGFPSPTTLGFTPKITKGVISAVNGFNDDARFYQIDASIQPGNSGGPLADEYGNLVGIVAATINANYFKNVTGAAPQNVNYSIKKSCLLSFLESRKELEGKLDISTENVSAPFEDIVEKVQKSTVQIIIY